MFWSLPGLFPRERQASLPLQVSHAAGHVLHSDSVPELWAHHLHGWQANHHYFFQQKDGNYFGRALISNGSCLTLLCTGSSHLEMASTGTGRAGMDVEEHKMWPRGIWIHHKVPDMLHPHQSPQHSGLAVGWVSVLAPAEQPLAKSTAPARSSARRPGQTGASSPCSSTKAMSCQHRLPQGVFQQGEASLNSHCWLSKEQTRKAGQKIP